MFTFLIRNSFMEEGSRFPFFLGPFLPRSSLSWRSKSLSFTPSLEFVLPFFFPYFPEIVEVTVLYDRRKVMASAYGSFLFFLWFFDFFFRGSFL